MVFRISTLNSLQVNPDVPIVTTITNFGSTPAVAYTCPAGKKARVVMLSDRLVALGSNSKMNVIIGGITIRSPNVPDALQVIEQIGNMTLTAGQTISFSGDNVANNGTVNVFATITELPA